MENFQALKSASVKKRTNIRYGCSTPVLALLSHFLATIRALIIITSCARQNVGEKIEIIAGELPRIDSYIVCPQLVFDPVSLKSAKQVFYEPTGLEGFLSFLEDPVARYVIVIYFHLYFISDGRFRCASISCFKVVCHSVSKWLTTFQIFSLYSLSSLYILYHFTGRKPDHSIQSTSEPSASLFLYRGEGNVYFENLLTGLFPSLYGNFE